MRYKVYGWTEDDAINYEQDFGKELYEALEEDYWDVVDYGTFIGETNDEDEAYRMTDGRYDYCSIWDNENKGWFN